MIMTDPDYYDYFQLPEDNGALEFWMWCEEQKEKRLTHWDHWEWDDEHQDFRPSQLNQSARDALLTIRRKAPPATL